MASYQTPSQLDPWGLYFNHPQGTHQRANHQQGSNSQFLPFGQQLPLYHAAYMSDQMEPYQLMQSQSMPKESKPRLSKEEQATLEAEFRKNRKPTTNTKKSLADEMRLEHSRVNNWFQNRRARERRERNMRAYEARQRTERERAEGENASQDSDSNSDRVASSAPFPDLHHSKQSPDALLDLSVLEDDNDLSSPMFPSTEDEESVQGEQPSEDRQSVFSVSDVNLDTASSMRLPVGQLELPMSYDNEEFMMQGERRTTPINMPMNKRLRSPLDVCIGRNRRPDPLAISGSRSHPGTSRAGFEASRAHAFSMRRHASVNGTSLSSPVRRNGSPIDASSIAPPTPITPIVSNPNIGCPPTVKYSSSALSEDPALTTPPDTPGMTNAFFHGISSYGVPMSEKVVIDPSLDSFPGQFDLSGSAPNYIASVNKARVAQSAAPSYGSQMGGSNSFLHDNTAQQYWSPAPVSDGSSPRGVDPFLTQFFSMNSYTGPTGYTMPNSYAGLSGYTSSNSYMGP